ncbi:MAG: peptidoglycan-associated lipoprotein Pal [Azospirillum sp.]|nr:peptidoglycan-associated lipoprotein Pal [Azospirillum sp.]
MRLKVLSLLAVAFLMTACADDGSKNAAASGANGNGTTVQPVGSGSLPRPGSQEDLAVNVGDRVFFATDRTDLSPEARRTLDGQAHWLQNYGAVTITVEGHADERGTREYNLALGNRRAIAVKNYLVALGINPSRITSISYGKERPSVLGSDEAAWAQNRRGVTVVN